MFANPIAPSKYFEGKAACGNPVETIHGVVLALTPGEEGPLPGWTPEGWNAYGQSQQSLHPKTSGARIYADVMQDTVREKMGL